MLQEEVEVNKTSRRMDSGFQERQQLAVNFLPLNQVEEHFGLLNQPDWLCMFMPCFPARYGNLWEERISMNVRYVTVHLASLFP